MCPDVETPYFHLVNKPKLGAELVCGGRTILLRGSTGERGPVGPFPFITLTERKEEGDFMEGFCIHSEDRFNEVWDKLKELMPSRE